MTKLLLFLIVFLGTSCFGQENIRIQIQDSTTENNCVFTKDTVDFGTGKSAYYKNLLCLDSVFTFDHFETSNVVFTPILLDETQKRLNWNACTINSGSKDSIVINTKNRIIHLHKKFDYQFESAYEVTVGKKQYLVVFLFPSGISSHLIPYPVLIFNDKNEFVHYIDNDRLFSPNPACFCDVDHDNELEYIELDYNTETVQFYAVDTWELKSNFTRKIRELYDWIYVFE